MKLLKKLVEIDANWVPDKEGYSLYLRPTLIGTQPSLGVGETKEALLFVIMSPVGPYYSSVVKPVALEANPERVRAWPGGTGNAKLGANYGPCILPQREAAKKGGLAGPRLGLIDTEAEEGGAQAGAKGDA